MTKQQLKLLSVVAVLLVLTSLVVIGGIAIGSKRCMQSFKTFAFEGARYILEEHVAPLPPWQMESAASPVDDAGIAFTLYAAALARSFEGSREIWISADYEGAAVWAVYVPETEVWEMISPHIVGTTSRITQLFLLADGTIWGVTYTNTFSRFDAAARRFERGEGILETSLVPTISDGFSWSQIVLDHHDVFWIFAENGGIYRFDPAALTVEQPADFPGAPISYVALSQDGSIYFNQEFWRDDQRLAEGMIFQFFPETSEIKSVDLADADETWPLFAGLLVDHAGRLWLGAVGYRDTDETWHLVHPPYLQDYEAHLGQIVWATPRIMLESSDAILWYQRYMDTSGRAEGTAWYDPETGEGCLFTTVPVNIVEDPEQTLWLVADGALYKYPLNP